MVRQRGMPYRCLAGRQNESVEARIQEDSLADPGCSSVQCHSSHLAHVPLQQCCGGGVQCPRHTNQNLERHCPLGVTSALHVLAGRRSITPRG